MNLLFLFLILCYDFEPLGFTDHSILVAMYSYYSYNNDNYQRWKDTKPRSNKTYHKIKAIYSTFYQLLISIYVYCFVFCIFFYQWEAFVITKGHGHKYKIILKKAKNIKCNNSPY